MTAKRNNRTRWSQHEKQASVGGESQTYSNFTAFMLNTAAVKIRREKTCFFKA